MATKEKTTSEPLRVLYYGDYKTHKTTDAAHMAKLGPVAFIAAEAGLKRNALLKTGLTASEFDRIKPFEWSSYREVEQLFFGLKATNKPPVGLVWDSSSISQQWVMDEIGDDKVAKRKAKGITDAEPFPYNQDDWTRGNERMRKLIRRFTTLPMHLAITALMRFEEEDAQGNDINKYVPAVTPGVQSALGGYVDMVIYCRVVEVGGELEYQGVCHPNEFWSAGDRLHVLPRILLNPTFDRLLAYAEGRLTVETDPVMQAARNRRAGKGKSKKKG
jgi:hypothetical protein